jgi:hypothetical protein
VVVFVTDVDSGEDIRHGARATTHESLTIVHERIMPAGGIGWTTNRVSVCHFEPSYAIRQPGIGRLTAGDVKRPRWAGMPSETWIADVQDESTTLGAVELLAPGGAVDVRR